MKNKILKFVGLLVLSISFSSCGGKDPSEPSVPASENPSVGVSTLPPVSDDTSVGTSINDSTSEEQDVLVETLTITPASLNLAKGDTGNLTVQVAPQELQGVVGITFQSANASIASVDQTGKVTAVGVGSTTITATADDASGVSDTIPVTVNKKYSSFETVITTGVTDKEFTVVGKVVAMYEGNVYQGIYIANGNHALQVFKAPSTVDVEIGDLVEVTGKYAWYALNRTTELVVDTGSVEVIDEVPEGVQFTEPASYTFDASTWGTITTSTTAADNIYTNRPITVTGMVTVVANTSQFKMIVDGTELIVYFRNATDIGDIHEDIAALEIGDEVTITGVIGSYNGATQIVAPNSVVVTPVEDHVAKLTIGTTVTRYQTLVEAFAAVPADDVLATIKLVKDFTGAGIELKKPVEGVRNIVLDLNGHTYTLNENLVGSPGTETNGLRFEPGNKVTIKNGTVNTTEGNSRLAILVQKYNDLVLEDVVLDASKAEHRNASGKSSWNYVVSNNNGTTTFKGDTKLISTGGVTRSEEGVTIYGGVAFDLCSFQSYEGVRVIIDPSFTGEFVGGIEYSFDSSSTADPSTWFESIVFVHEGKDYTVKNVEDMAKGDMKEYVDYETFFADLKLFDEEQKVPVTITKALKDYGWGNGDLADNPFNLDPIVSVTYAGGSNTGKYYNTGEGLRVYGNETGTITLIVPEGYEIQSVTLTFTYDSASSKASMDCTSGIANVQNPGTKEVTFTTSGTGGHVRISAISVTYVEL